MNFLEKDSTPNHKSKQHMPSAHMWGTTDNFKIVNEPAGQLVLTIFHGLFELRVFAGSAILIYDACVVCLSVPARTWRESTVGDRRGFTHNPRFDFKYFLQIKI